MRAARKWIKYTISGGIVCFTCTLYLLCMMAPPGQQIEQTPPGVQPQNVQKYHATAQPNSNSSIKRSQLSNLAGIVRSTSSDRGLVVNVWPKSMGKSDQRHEDQNKDAISPENPLCQSDCKRLEALFKRWPKTKPKALIYYLTRVSRLAELKRSLESLEQSFNGVYKYPIVIFHESDLITSIPVIRQWTNSSIYFQLVTFLLPNFLTKPVLENIPCRSTIGYRHMCRFNAKLVYEQPIMQWVEFLWRLDDESLLTDKVPYDVFKFMKTRSLQYGYIWEHRDAKNCVTDLWNSTRRYIQQHNIPPNAFSTWKSPKLYYNNFEISSMALWRSQEYRSFIDYIDRLGGIYYHRWGDAPIKGIAVNLFVPKNKLHHFKDINYQHNTFSNP